MSAALEHAATGGRSLWADARRRLFANKAAVTAMVILAVIVVLAALGPLLSPNTYDDIDFRAFREPPTWDAFHIFGTDGNGRDLFVRTMIGAQVSLSLGLLATFVALIIGVTYGAIAGYAGGKTDMVMMRAVDILYAMPFLFFVIILMVLFGRHVWLIFIGVGCVEWLTMARIVRGQVISLKQKEFVEAARAIGAPPRRILFRHIVPNLLGVVLIYTTLTVPQVILIESFLSFLGLGVQEPLTSWGVLIKEGADEMESALWMLLFPAAFLATTLFCLNFIGDGLRDALDPKER
jgi:oligopeptide transport system permease protein